MASVAALSDLQRDALREVGGIGAGHAATALSQLVDRQVTLEVPRVDVIQVRDVPGVFGGPERLAIGVYARIVGDITGGILFMAERDAALRCVDMLRGRPAGATVAQSPEDEALLSHAASVLIAAYLAAIARMADVHVLPLQQSYACDMAGALLQAAFAQTEEGAEETIMLRTALVESACAADVAVFFLPDADSLTVLLGRLGVV